MTFFSLLDNFTLIFRGVTKRGQGATIPRAPNDCRGPEKSQECHKYSLQYSTFASERLQVRTWWRQTCFLPRAPSNLVTPPLILQS